MALETLGYWTGDTAAVDEQYESYCLRCHELSQQTGLPLRDVDRALYILGGRTEQWLSQSVTSTPTKTSSSSKGDFIMGLPSGKFRRLGAVGDTISWSSHDIDREYHRIEHQSQLDRQIIDRPAAHPRDEYSLMMKMKTPYQMASIRPR